MTDLQLTSTDELLDELRKRYDSMMFAGVKFLNTKSEYVTTRRWYGNRMVLTALSSNFSHIFSREELLVGGLDDKGSCEEDD